MVVVLLQPLVEMIQEKVKDQELEMMIKMDEAEAAEEGMMMMLLVPQVQVTAAALAHSSSILPKYGNS